MCPIHFLLIHWSPFLVRLVPTIPGWFGVLMALDLKYCQKSSLKINKPYEFISPSSHACLLRGVTCSSRPEFNASYLNSISILPLVWLCSVCSHMQTLILRVFRSPNEREWFVFPGSGSQCLSLSANSITLDTGNKRLSVLFRRSPTLPPSSTCL